MLRRAVLTAFATLALAAVASACPFCGAQGQTLAGEVSQDVAAKDSQPDETDRSL